MSVERIEVNGRELTAFDLPPEPRNTYHVDVGDENAKLRELCRRFIEYVSQDRCEGCACKSRCNDGEIDECWMLAEVREIASELGMEVD